MRKRISCPRAWGDFEKNEFSTSKSIAELRIGKANPVRIVPEFDYRRLRKIERAYNELMKEPKNWIGEEMSAKEEDFEEALVKLYVEKWCKNRWGYTEDTEETNRLADIIRSRLTELEQRCEDAGKERDQALACKNLWENEHRKLRAENEQLQWKYDEVRKWADADIEKLKAENEELRRHITPQPWKAMYDGREQAVEELRAENEKLLKERDRAIKARDTWKHMAVKRMETFPELARLRARIEGSPKVWIIYRLDSSGDWPIYGIHSKKPNLDGEAEYQFEEVYVVPVLEEEKEEPFYSTDPEMNEALKLDDQKLRDLGAYDEEEPRE